VQRGPAALDVHQPAPTRRPYHAVTSSSSLMSALRQRLPRFAALVLLVWLFASGVAFAHTCSSKVYVDCDECCTEMKAAAAWSETRAITVSAAQPAIAPPIVTVAVQPAWQPGARESAPTASPPDPGGGQRIPIFFLRLAL
jgi:hypothetical protein